MVARSSSARRWPLLGAAVAGMLLAARAVRPLGARPRRASSSNPSGRDRRRRRDLLLGGLDARSRAQDRRATRAAWAARTRSSAPARARWCEASRRRAPTPSACGRSSRRRLAAASRCPEPYGTVTLVVDRTAPGISVRLSPGSPNGDNGWYRSLTVVWTCGDRRVGDRVVPGRRGRRHPGRGPAPPGPGPRPGRQPQRRRDARPPSTSTRPGRAPARCAPRARARSSRPSPPSSGAPRRAARPRASTATR